MTKWACTLILRGDWNCDTDKNIHDAIKTALDMYHIQKKSNPLVIRLYGHVPGSELGFSSVALIGDASTDIYY